VRSTAGTSGPDHGAEWVLAPIHHENAEHVDIPPHNVDMPWDVSRMIYPTVMSYVHCTDFDWAMHPEAATDYGPYPNSGTISRISFRHRSDGCTGALRSSERNA
jgi:hypothetical protein